MPDVDVLFRHCKGHNQVAINHRKENEEQGHGSFPAVDGASHNSQFHLAGHMAGPTPAPSLQGGEVPLPEGVSASVMHVNSGHRMEALINAAQHLDPAAYTSWQSPNSMHPDNYQLTSHHDSNLNPPIDPSMESLSFTPAGNVGTFDPWAFDLMQNHQSALSQTPSNSLRSWLYPPESNMDTPNGSHRLELDGMMHDDRTAQAVNDQGSPSDAMSIASKIPQERFARVAECWPAQISRTTRIMPILWQDVASRGCPNIFCDEAAPPVEQIPIREERNTSRWNLDSSDRSCLQDILARAPLSDNPRLDHRGSYAGANSVATTGANPSSLQFPPTEILDIALEMYQNYFHPTLPVIHVPTFSTKQASRPLLLSMCLIGLSILGTAGAVRFVTQSFPSLLQVVLSDLRSLRSSEDPPQQHMRTIATGLLALNLASITGRKNRIAQAEELYIELLTVSQNQGLFSVNDGANVDILLSSLEDAEGKWRAWINVECVKRITYGLIQADCWWAGHLSSSPIIRPELVQVYPVTNQSLYQAESLMTWCQLVESGISAHAHAITPFPDLAPSPNPKALNLACNQLTLISLRMCEASDRLAVKTNHQHLEPWRLFVEDERSRGIVPLMVSFRSITDLNSIVLWHKLCMKLGANMQHFELAAGRAGAGPAATALDQISTWSHSSTARRSILHAAHIYKLLSDRKVSEIVHPHSIVALFQAALVLGLYIFTVEPSANTDPTINTSYELSNPVEWTAIGGLGLANSSQPSCVSGTESAAARFIEGGGSLSMANVTLEGGYAAARKTLLHCADLMEGMGRWKSRTFSQILHIMSDDLTEFNGPDHDDG
ncbi:DNA binding [Ascochyta rabiei]|uniref:DNA binding n=1 Tax=Didymella rabiei TaxID=5454 RepID=A0A163FPH8_DIDRA|nr:DNA binding [Ascochyta rabiei]